MWVLGSLIFIKFEAGAVNTYETNAIEVKDVTLHFPKQSNILSMILIFLLKTLSSHH